MKLSARSRLLQKASIIRDTILSANDGVITTFAVVAGANGANLSSNTVILLGLANLLADAISMASGIYLGMESENEILEQNHNIDTNISPLKSAIITFCAFAIAGAIPLTPYFFIENVETRFYSSIILVAIALISLGFLRGNFSKKHPTTTTLETILIGGVSAIIAYMIGYWGDAFLNS
jgi:vacuolar iron transporter family protein